MTVLNIDPVGYIWKKKLNIACIGCSKYKFKLDAHDSYLISHVRTLRVQNKIYVQVFVNPFIISLTEIITYFKQQL